MVEFALGQGTVVWKRWSWSSLTKKICLSGLLKVGLISHSI